jgi:hypothetical protein
MADPGIEIEIVDGSSSGRWRGWPPWQKGELALALDARV